jgi:O-acetyl-ADP-ribose deacetylase (regulator of RNase III)
MIKEVQGDILKTTCRAIAHGIAPNDHFDSGLAAQLREFWPALAKDFRHWMHTHRSEPGGLWTWTTPDGRRIVNLLTQAAAPDEKSHPGKAHLTYVNHALRELRAEIVREKIESIALPRLATGVGGLAWDDVRPLIQHHLGELGIPVYVYTVYKRDVVAKEA